VARSKLSSQHEDGSNLISMRLRPINKIALIAALSAVPFTAFAKDKHSTAPPQDQIQVVGHISVRGDTVVRFFATQHYRRNYLYAEHESGKNISLIDITDIGHPELLAEVNDPAGKQDSLVSVTGNAVLVAVAGPQTGTSADPQTFRIMSFADPLHPVVQREFKEVSATARDDHRGLIFLANPEGIWILRQQYATDPQAEKEWEHMMLDAR
jgi:hypothetical protein